MQLLKGLNFELDILSRLCFCWHLTVSEINEIVPFGMASSNPPAPIDIF